MAHIGPGDVLRHHSIWIVANLQGQKCSNYDRTGCGQITTCILQTFRR